MSMFTPPGVGGRGQVRRGKRRSWPALLVAVLLVLALAGAGWWLWQRDTDEPVATAERSACPTPSTPPAVVPPGKVKVNVYNATERRGLAARVATQLRKRGFQVAKVDNDPLERRVTGLAEVRHSEPGAAAARTVVAQVGTVVAVPDQRTDASVDLVLGAGFRALQPVAAATAALSPTPQPMPAAC
jgi:hypothetical protein